MDTPIYYKDLIQPDDSIEKLIAELQQLSQQFSSNITKIREEAQGLQTALKGVSGATEEGRKVTQQASTDVEKLANQHRKLAEAESENNRELQRLKTATTEANKIAKLEAQIANSVEGSYKRISAQYALNKIELDKMSASERQVAEQERQLVSKTNELYQSMKRLQAETGQHQLNVGNYPDMTNAIQALSTKITGLIGLNGQLGSSFVQLGQNASGTTSILEGLKSGFSSLGSVLGGLLTNPVFLSIAGVAGVGFGVKAWYDYNNGLVEATRLTRELANVSGEDLVNIRTYIQAMADTWGTDFKDTIQAVDAVSANFKITFQEASEAIKDGFVAGANLNGDFLNKLKQYPAYFKEAGLSARQFISIVTQTKSGIFGDKGLDAIKQANARIREMGDSMKDVLNDLNLGMNAEEIEAQLTAGAMNTFDVLQMVSEKLAELPPQSQLVGETLVTVFGKQGRDAGLEMIKSLKDIETNLDECKQKTGEFGQMEEAQMKAQKELQRALASLFDSTGGSFEKMNAKIKLVVTQGLTKLIYKVIDLYNAFVDLWNESELVRGLLLLIPHQAAVAFKVLVDVIKGIAKVLMGAGNIMKSLFITHSFSDMEKGLEQALSGGFNIVVDPWKEFAKGAKSFLGAFNSKLEYLHKPDAGGAGHAGGGGGGGFRSGSGSVNDDDNNYDNSGSGSGSGHSGRGRYTGGSNGSSYRYTPSRTPTPPSNDAEREAERLAMEEERKYQQSLRISREAQDKQLEADYQDFELKIRKQTLLYNRKIEDLTHQLKVDSKKLTPEDVANIKAEITAIEQIRDRTIAEMNANRDEIDRQEREKRELKEKKAKIAELKAEKEAIELRLKAIKEGSAEELNLRLEKLEKEREIALAENKLAEHPLDEKLINEAFNEERNEIIKGYGEILQSMMDKQNEIENSEIELLDASERRKTQLRLQAEKERIKKLLALQKLGLIQMTQDEVKLYENQLKLIDKQLGTLPYSDIYDVFGLDLTDEQKQAIDKSLQYAQEAINTFMQAYVQEAERKASLADQAVEDSKRVLETEQEARANGYASNVEYAQKELEQSKRMQEKAHRQAVTAQRQQILLDSALQASSLITATANIWKAFTGTGPWGIAAAIAATATMWGAFTASKIKAMSMVGQDEEYGEGTVELLQGGSHQSGNDVDLGRKADGTRRRAEGGEFFAVINKRNSRRFRHIIPDVINSLNDGSFPSKYMNAVKTDDGIIFNLNNQTDISGLSSDVSAIRRQNERKTYVDGNGNTIIVYNNLKRTIRR